MSDVRRGMRVERPLFAWSADCLPARQSSPRMRDGRSGESKGPEARMAEVRPIIPTDFAYTRTAIALHWVTVALIATGFVLGTQIGRVSFSLKVRRL